MGKTLNNVNLKALDNMFGDGAFGGEIITLLKEVK